MKNYPLAALPLLAALRRALRAFVSACTTRSRTGAFDPLLPLGSGR